MKKKKKTRRRCKKCNAFCDGKPTLCDLFRGNLPTQMQRPGNWPLKGSLGMAVSAKQMKLAMKLNHERGCPPTRYEPDKHGYTYRPVFESPMHQKRFLKCHKVANNRSFL